MPANPLDLDVRGLLDVDAQLALLELSPQLRRRLLNNVTKRVRSMSQASAYPAEPGRHPLR